MSELLHYNYNKFIKEIKFSNSKKTRVHSDIKKIKTYNKMAEA